MEYLIIDCQVHLQGYVIPQEDRSVEAPTMNVINQVHYH